MSDSTAHSTVERIASVLLAVAAAALAFAAVAGFGWYRANHRAVALGDLSQDARRALAAELQNVAPGIHALAWYEPKIGYTLHPDRELEAWDDRFTTNELGFRTWPTAKKPKTFRVLFVGDSWTYGMGVHWEESFPKVVETIANQQGIDRPIEAWTLALPGYNTFNYLGALWYFYDRLEPDAVVVAPTTNDNHSTALVMPDGSLIRTGGRADDFGHEHVVTYRVNHLDSFRSRERWAMSFAEMRETERRLRARGVPLMFFFVARWQDEIVHHFMQQAGMESPYMVVPIPLTLGEEWVNPPPMDHGNPAANRVYGEALYRGLAGLLGWPTIAQSEPAASISFYPHVPPDRDWAEAAKGPLRWTNRRHFETFWRMGGDQERQVAGPMIHATGQIGHATTILVNRVAGKTRLRVTVQRIDELPDLYPLPLTVRIPAAGGGTATATVIPADGPAEHTFTVPVPDDVEPGAALDVVFVAERTEAGRDRFLGPRSLAILAVEPID